MKITLCALNSSYIHTNLAVLYIKNAIKDLCICNIIEGTIKDKHSDILSSLVNSEGDIYGFSCYIWNITEMKKLANELKLINPNCKIVFGGPEMYSADKEKFLENNPYVDCVIIGEGEEAFRSISTGGEVSGYIYSHPSTSFESCGILYDYKPKGKIVYYESSRGCPFGCKYCLSGRNEKVRAKGAEKIFEDLLAFQTLSNEIKIVKFVDRTFNFDPDRANKVFRELKKDKYKLSYHFEIVASLLNEESFEILSDYPKGKIQFEIGVQSTNPQTLMSVCRRNDSAKAIANAKRLYDMGNIHIHCDLIAGLPYESFERFGQSFNDLYGSCNMLQLGFLKILKGSEMEREADNYSIKYSPYPPYEILSNKWISYNELCRLHGIADFLERIEESGKFFNTVNYLRQYIKSPFAFYNGICDYFEKVSGESDVRKLTQNALFRLVYEYAKKTDGINNEYLADYLRFDYLLQELTPLPEFMKRSNIKSDEEKSLLKNFINGHSSLLDKTATDIYKFVFNKDHYMVIDRKNHNYFTI